MPEQFISEPIQPAPESFDTSYMADGLPGLPREFSWQGYYFHIVDVLRTWRTTKPCSCGSDERYARRYWFEVKTTSGHILKIYFDKGMHGSRAEMGWHLFTVSQK